MEWLYHGNNGYSEPGNATKAHADTFSKIRPLVCRREVRPAPILLLYFKVIVLQGRLHRHMTWHATESRLRVLHLLKINK